VTDHIRAELQDVLSQELAGDRVSSLDVTVAATHTVAAEHDEILTHVVARVLEDVVQREADRHEVHAEADAVAEDALFPLVMERLHQRPITNACFRAWVYEQPDPAQWLRIPCVIPHAPASAWPSVEYQEDAVSATR
jgi:hypothetical protein